MEIPDVGLHTHIYLLKEVITSALGPEIQDVTISIIFRSQYN